MSIKSRPASGKSVKKLEVVRAATSYAGARWMLSAPFMVMGVLAMMSFVWQIVTGAWFLSLGALVVAVFCFGLIALAGAIFDLADCAILAEVRAKAKESKDAYEAYRSIQASEP